MPVFKLTFKEKKQVAAGTFEFIFSKPEDFEYEAGQNLDWTLIDAKENDAEGLLRTFSLTSAPHESYLAFATRMRDSAFKRQLAKFEPGQQIQASDANGDMTLQVLGSENSAVFLAGGIGITPFLSMIKDAVHKKLSTEISLFYSNHSEADAPFFKDLQKLTAELPHGKFIPTMTNDTTFQGEQGYITDVMIKKYIQDVARPIYFVAGPPAMAEAMKKTLRDMGVPRLHIVSENFDGYEKERKPLG